jgi:hypothetical protein
VRKKKEESCRRWTVGGEERSSRHLGGDGEEKDWEGQVGCNFWAFGAFWTRKNSLRAVEDIN